MPDFTLPPGCVGLDLKGQKYDSSDGSHVTVDRPDHIKAIGLAGDTYNLNERIAVTAHLPGWDCACGFAAYRWQHTCPRCGEERPLTGGLLTGPVILLPLGGE